MTQYDISISREQVAGLLNDTNVLGEMVRDVINQVLHVRNRRIVYTFFTKIT